MWLAIIFVSQVAGNAAASSKYSRVIPGFRQHRGNVERRILVAGLGNPALLGKAPKLFSIELFNPAKTAELAFHSVEVAVMVSLSRNEPVAADEIVRDDS